jgi:hypothetical protein
MLFWRKIFLGKYFMMKTFFKTVNHFSKIKEEFLVKGKLFSVDYYFTSRQTPENM